MITKRRKIISPYQFDRIQQGYLNAKGYGFSDTEAAMYALNQGEIGISSRDQLPQEVELVVDWSLGTLKDVP